MAKNIIFTIDWKKFYLYSSNRAFHLDPYFQILLPDAPISEGDFYRLHSRRDYQAHAPERYPFFQDNFPVVGIYSTPLNLWFNHIKMGFSLTEVEHKNIFEFRVRSISCFFSAVNIQIIFKNKAAWANSLFLSYEVNNIQIMTHLDLHQLSHIISKSDSLLLN